MHLKPFPHYPQQESVDCGPSCLRMIAKYYGKVYSAEMLRKRCFISREGVSLLGISDAAESIGIRTVGVQISFEQLANDALLPCILHWNQNHFVVCYEIDKHKHNGRLSYKIHISDPATQRISLSREEFEKCWISSRNSQNEVGVALMLEPGPNFGKIEDDYRTSSKGLSYFIKYLLPFKSLSIQLAFGLIAGCIIQFIFPFLSQAMVDKGINGKNLNLITLILIAQLSLFLAQLLIGYCRDWIMLHINTRIDINLISDFLTKIMNMPLHFFDTKRTGDIMQRIGDHSRIKSFLLGNSMNIIFSLFNFLVFMSILAYYNTTILGIFMIQ